MRTHCRLFCSHVFFCSLLCRQDKVRSKNPVASSKGLSKGQPQQGKSWASGSWKSQQHWNKRSWSSQNWDKSVPGPRTPKKVRVYRRLCQWHSVCMSSFVAYRAGSIECGTSVQTHQVQLAPSSCHTISSVSFSFACIRRYRMHETCCCHSGYTGQVLYACLHHIALRLLQELGMMRVEPAQLSH